MLGAAGLLLQPRGPDDDPPPVADAVLALSPAVDPAASPAVRPDALAAEPLGPAPVANQPPAPAPALPGTLAARDASSAPRKDAAPAPPAKPPRGASLATEAPRAAAVDQVATSAPHDATSATGESAVAAEPTPGPAPAEVRAVSSARVIHRHRLGSCRGVLGVSGQGIVYAPEDDAKDAFRLPYGQFVHGVDGHELTIKTSDRTFRFEPVTVNGKRDAADLSALAASLNARR